MAIDISNPIHTSVHAFHPVSPSVVDSQHAPASGTPKAEIQHTVSQMNTLSQVINHRLKFTLDQETNDVIVKVIDADTDKVITELPAVELQKLHKSIKEAVGLLINKLI